MYANSQFKLRYVPDNELHRRFVRKLYVSPPRTVDQQSRFCGTTRLQPRTPGQGGALKTSQAPRTI